MNFINKKNRKLYGAICVMIAFKFYEESCCDFNHEKIKTLVRAVNALDNHYILQHKAIARYEFEVYSHLKFSVLIPVEEYEENFHHVLSRIGKTAEEYLSDMLPFSGLKYPHQEFR